MKESEAKTNFIKYSFKAFKFIILYPVLFVKEGTKQKTPLTRCLLFELRRKSRRSDSAEALPDRAKGQYRDSISRSPIYRRLARWRPPACRTRIGRVALLPDIPWSFLQSGSEKWSWSPLSHLFHRSQISYGEILGWGLFATQKAPKFRRESRPLCLSLLSQATAGEIFDFWTNVLFFNITRLLSVYLQRISLQL